MLLKEEHSLVKIELQSKKLKKSLRIRGKFEIKTR